MLPPLLGLGPVRCEKPAPFLNFPGVCPVNKSDLVRALAARTKMSKVDAGRTVEALFAPNGVIAGELRKGSKVLISGFGNFEVRKRAARRGRNPRNGREIQIKASVATVFRAGKGLKEVVGRRK
jgi:DNA-binding protein HU-beta